MRRDPTLARHQRGGAAGRNREHRGHGHLPRYTPDGRCVSLLKLPPDEVVRLTLEFYRPSYIEGQRAVHVIDNDCHGNYGVTNA